jgi:hypothetical protein
VEAWTTSWRAAADSGRARCGIFVRTESGTDDGWRNSEMGKAPAKKTTKKLAVKKSTLKNLSVPKGKADDVKGGVGGTATCTCAPSVCKC